MEEESAISVFSKNTRKRQKRVEPQPAEPCTRDNKGGQQSLAGDARVAPPDQSASGAVVKLVDGDDEPLTGFRALGVTAWLDRVCDSLGIRTPTAVQKGCIPSILEVQSRAHDLWV